jgi:hypothetical protein
MTTLSRFKLLADAIEQCLQQFDKNTLAVVDATYFEKFKSELSSFVENMVAIEFLCLAINELNQVTKCIGKSLPLFKNICNLIKEQVEI